MSSGFYSNSNTLFNNSDLASSEWDSETVNFDSSAYVNYSPQLDNHNLAFSRNEGTAGHGVGTSQHSSATTRHVKQEQPSRSFHQHPGLAQNTSSNRSSASEQESSRSSISPSTVKRSQPSDTSPTFFDSNPTTARNSNLSSVKAEEDFGGFDTGSGALASQEELLFHNADTNMNTEMDNLTLQPGTGFGFGDTSGQATLTSDLFADTGDGFGDANLDDLNPDMSLQSPGKTVQPNKTFFLGGSREDSPNDLYMAGKESPSFAFVDDPSSMNANATLFGTGSANHSNRNSAGYGAWNTGPSSLHNSSDSPLARTMRAGSMGQPRITIDSIPDKSRVETQIPIHMTLHNPPRGIRRLHLPHYTISKPKFQQRPSFPGTSDTLELHVLLVCASAMHNKKGALETAFKRAERGEVPVRKEGSDDGRQDQDHMDDDDPNKPLNGGPIAICSGCMQRERKRAARKKTKKPDEEDEWLKDEAKRVIVFNCAEVRDWCLPDGEKETPVKEHSGGALPTMVIQLPMRIACYCRHQQEKMGFQVIFTLKTIRGETLCQAISPSIMITDDHKQPIPQPGQPAIGFAPAGVLDGNGNFFPTPQQYDFYEAQAAAANGRDLPFRPSLSTPDLRNLQSQFAPQLGQLPRQFSSTNLVNNSSTTSGTPRNLSRPASPTNPVGQPGAKKRRSGGSTNKIPTNLHMTSIETSQRSPRMGGGGAFGGVTSAPTSASFNFTSPSSGSFGNTPLDSSMTQTSLRTPTNFASGPSTPLHPPTSHFNEIDPSQFYSAPTSQHASRAPSPNSTSRVQYPGNSGLVEPQQSVPSAAADALRALPPGINLSRPPTLQRLIPSRGPRSGGEEVTVLGAGFFQGLEVMFGDTPAVSTVFWGESTLVCRAPPSRSAGSVAVMFKHQHQSAPAQVRELQNLMPTRLVTFTYLDDSVMRNSVQMQGMAGLQQAGTFPGSGNGTPTGTGSVSPPNLMGSGGNGSMEDLTTTALNPRAYMGYMGQASSPSGGPGSAGFNAASFARTPMGQHEAAQAVAGRRMAPTRTVSGNGLTR